MLVLCLQSNEHLHVAFWLESYDIHNLQRQSGLIAGAVNKVGAVFTMYFEGFLPLEAHMHLTFTLLSQAALNLPLI